MTQRIFTSALFAGLAVGLIVAALQFAFFIPLLLEGELFESGARIHFSASGSPQSDAGAPPYTAEHLRHLLTIAFNMVTYSGFGLLMAAGFAVVEQRGGRVTLRDGLLWGLGGFAAIVMAPAFGLPPELPGSITAEVGPRQAWWFATVLATLAGLLVATFGRGVLPIAAGLVLILAPHVFGAPHLDTYFGIAPPELSALFATRALGIALTGWLLLGGLTAWFWTRPHTA